MQACQFSETQFESYHSRQLESLLGSALPQYFPSRHQEKNIGVDLVHFTNYFNIFLQYKVPTRINSSNPRCKGLVGNCFRMKVYNKRDKTAKGQYDLLWDWAATEDHVYYVTPMFNTDNEFYLRYKDIIQYSAHFNFRKGMHNPYSAGFNSKTHYIYYSDSSAKAMMYSEEPAEINVVNLDSLSKSIIRTRPKRETFDNYLSVIKSGLRESIDANDNAQREVSSFIEMLQRKESTIEDYKLCGFLLQRYFGVSWTVLFDRGNLKKPSI